MQSVERWICPTLISSLLKHNDGYVSAERPFHPESSVVEPAAKIGPSLLLSRGKSEAVEPSHSSLEDAAAAGVFHISHRSGDGYMYVTTAIRPRGLGRSRSRAEFYAGVAFAPARAAKSSPVRELAAAEPLVLWCEWRGPARGREHF